MLLEVDLILTEHAVPKNMPLGSEAETINSNLEIAAEEIGEQGLTDQAKSSLLGRIPVLLTKNVTKVMIGKAG